MYRDKPVCEMAPVHNEETPIVKVIKTMPDYVGKIMIICDKSWDGTIPGVKKYQLSTKGSCSSPTRRTRVWAAQSTRVQVGPRPRHGHHDGERRLDGPGDESPTLLDHIVVDRADYSKGNRIFTGEEYKMIHKVWCFGNVFLSLFAKITSGCWHIADFQLGYTVINKCALHLIDWDRMYKHFGQINDMKGVDIAHHRVIRSERGTISMKDEETPDMKTKAA